MDDSAQRYRRRLEQHGPAVFRARYKTGYIQIVCFQGPGIKTTVISNSYV